MYLYKAKFYQTYDKLHDKIKWTGEIVGVPQIKAISENSIDMVKRELKLSLLELIDTCLKEGNTIPTPSPDALSSCLKFKYETVKYQTILIYFNAKFEGEI